SLNRITAAQMSSMIREAGFTIVREQRMTLDIGIPESLLKQYSPDDLRTNGILLLAEKQR
ncbi:hypothetical protein, partial [Thiolapillus sp.]